VLIAIEGIDGAGKNTQAALLCDALRQQGYSAEILSFPRYGETFFAKSITDYLSGRFGNLGSVDPHFAALLYAGDRFETKRLILELRESVDVVIFDRYVASNLAHQASRVPLHTRDEFFGWLATLEYDVYGLPKADATVYLNITTEAASALLRQRRQLANTGSTDLHESDTAYLEQCRQVYLVLLQKSFHSRWTCIDCCDRTGEVLPRKTIADAIWQAIQPTLVGSPQPQRV
jgi:dTMP kinase